MKNDLAQLIRGKTLRSQIYNSISCNKLTTVSRLLRHTLNQQRTHRTDLKFIDLKSEITGMKTQMGSPAPKTEHSLKKFSQSVTDSCADRHHKSTSKSRERKLELELRQQKIIGETHKNKSKSAILGKVGLTSPKQILKSGSKSQLIRTKSRQKEGKIAGKKRRHQPIQALQNRSSKLNSNLESIIEQSSSDEQLITPDAKKRGKSGVESPYSNFHSQTKKKERVEIFSESYRRRLYNSFKSPQIFQKLMKNNLLTISYRILKNRLIEIEIYTLKPINYLKVSLDKGNLQCQNIHQQYRHLSDNTLLALFSSVRDINLDQLTHFPKIEIQVNQIISSDLKQQDEKLHGTLTLPYTWLHFIDERLPSTKRSKIKTKLCLCDLPISTTKLNVLSQIFHVWTKRSFKGQASFQTVFAYSEQQFSLKLIEQPSESFTLQLQGKGEQRLTQMISFLQHLIS